MLFDHLLFGAGVSALTLAGYFFGSSRGFEAGQKQARRVAEAKSARRSAQVERISAELQERREREESRVAEVVPICRHAAAVPSCRTCGRRAS